MMSFSKTRVLISLFAAAAIGACGSDESQGSGDGCTTGQTQACTCEDTGRSGAQTCVDGSFGECMCTCGNGMLDQGELCDGPTTSENCASATMMARPNGVLTCNSDCTLNTTGCTAPATTPPPAGGGGMTGRGGASSFGGTTAGGGFGSL